MGIFEDSQLLAVVSNKIQRELISWEPNELCGVRYEQTGEVQSYCFHFEDIINYVLSCCVKMCYV